jgi:hypothetical protein
MTARSLYERLIEATDARELLKALRKPPPEITDTTSWRIAIDQALAEADRLDAVWFAAEVADWTERWPDVRRKIEKAGARVREVEEGVFAIDIRRTYPDWCEVDLTRAEITTEVCIGRSYGEHPLDAIVGEVASAIATYEANQAVKARLTALKQTHAWDHATRRWRPKIGDGPVFTGKVTVAEYEAAMRAKLN